MKKFKRGGLLIAAIVMMISVMMFAGCSGKSDKMVGTWKAESVEVAGASYTMDDFTELTGQTMDFEIEFKKGGKVSVIVDTNGEVEEGSGSYKLDGDKVTLSSWLDSSTEDLECSVKDDEFTMEYQGVKIIFQKQK